MSKPSARTPCLLNDAVNRPDPEKTSGQPWRPTSPHRAPPCRGAGDLRRALITSLPPLAAAGRPRAPSARRRERPRTSSHGRGREARASRACSEPFRS
eukprot:1321951-Pyramimonas_sp.AAC.1